MSARKEMDACESESTVLGVRCGRRIPDFGFQVSFCGFRVQGLALRQDVLHSRALF
jgi:hypothetical protein